MSVTAGSPPSAERPKASAARAQARRRAVVSPQARRGASTSARASGRAAAHVVAYTGSDWKTPEKRRTSVPAPEATVESPRRRSATKKTRRTRKTFASARAVGEKTTRSGDSGQKTAAFGSAAKARPADIHSFQSGTSPDRRSLARTSLHGTKKKPASRRYSVPPARNGANRRAAAPKTTARTGARCVRAGESGPDPLSSRRSGLPRQHEERHPERRLRLLLGLEQRHDPFEGAQLPFRKNTALENARVQPPAQDAGPVQVPDRFHREARASARASREHPSRSGGSGADSRRACRRARASRARGGRGALPAGGRGGSPRACPRHPRCARARSCRRSSRSAPASRSARSSGVSGNRNEAMRMFPCFSNRVRSSRT